jgi:catechol 2,3-dioxygenase-like lactoylglutathione lyase family enzyme
VFEVTLTAARQAGLVGRKRVLDSTALFDAVATMDTVTRIRSAIRGVPARGHVAFRVEDLDAWRDRLSSHGIEVEREIDWGAQRVSIYVRDQAGNSVELARGERWG